MWNELAANSGVWVWRYNVKLFSPANAVAVQLGDNGIAVISPPDNVPDACFTELEKFGPIVALVAPHSGHSIGQALWQSRYPDAGFYAPIAAHAKLIQLGLRQPLPLSDIPNSTEVEFQEIPGTKTGGTIMASRRGTRPVVYIDEIVGNHAALPGFLFLKLLFWITRSSPGIKINSVFATLLCTDKTAVAKAVLDTLDSSGGVAGDPIIVPAHGLPIVDPEDIRSVRGLLTPISK